MAENPNFTAFGGDGYCCSAQIQRRIHFGMKVEPNLKVHIRADVFAQHGLSRFASGIV